MFMFKSFFFHLESLDCEVMVSNVFLVIISLSGVCSRKACEP